MCRLPATSVSLLAAIVLAPVWAHAATDTAKPDQPTTTSISEVVVTAQKRREKIEKVPIAISAYTSGLRDLRGVDSIQDVAKFTPGMVYSTSLDRTFIRGVGRQTNTISVQPGVATYHDGIYYTSIVAASGDSLFVDRQEVLRGPQGTLYGKNAIGGAINAVSRRPTDELYAEVRTTLGNYGVYDVEGAVSGPIADGVRFRIAGNRFDQGQGYFQNVSGLKSEGGNGGFSYLEGQLDARLGPNVDAWIKFGAYTYDETLDPTVSPSPYDTAPFMTGTVSPSPAFGFSQPGFKALGTATQNPGVTDLRAFSTNTSSRNHVTDDYLAIAEVVWRTPWSADLKYLGGYYRYRNRALADADGTSMTSYAFPTEPSPACAPAPQCPPLSVFGTANFHDFGQNETVSNELDLTSRNSERIQWIVGLYQLRQQFTDDTRVDLPFQAEMESPLDAAPNPSRNVFVGDQSGTLDSYAGFAQVDWRIAPAFQLTGGLRYTYDSERAVEETRIICFGLPDCGAPASVLGALTPALDITPYAISFAPDRGVVGPPTLDPGTGLFSRRLSASWQAVTGTAGLEWTPDPHALIYAKYSRGYKAGGFNAGNIVPAPETRPEFLDAYELGVKLTFGDAVELNSALFFYDYQGMQIPLTVQPPDEPALSEIVNVGHVQAYGFELEGTWTPINDLQFFLNYAYLDARVRASQGCFVDDADPLAVQPGANTRGCPPDGSQNVDGQTIPQSPPNKVVFGGSYTLRFTWGALTYAANYAWTDQTYDEIFNRSYSLAPGWQTIDMRLIWNDARGRFTAIFFGKNILNALGYDNAQGSLKGDGTINRTFGLTAPATFGVELQYRFR
jgi:iron complex outermembrane receptor protein